MSFSNNERSVRKPGRLILAAAAAALGWFALSANTGYGREHWPAPTPESRARAKKAHDDLIALKEKLAPQLAAWDKKGKPYIPGASLPGDLPQADVPAFPGAEGGGKYSFGGRGGKVYVVTSLADSGPGTLREACEAAGPRIVVFNVAGIIHLKLPLHIVAPYITIAGQTAPGDGICVADQTFDIDTHDVVIRYMRFRRGEADVHNRDDALGGAPVGNIIIDHCSCSWGFDENISLYRHMYDPKYSVKPLKMPTVNLTIQWTISSEALNTYNHAFGGSWGGRNSTFHHDLFACNTARNPSVAMGYSFNFVNNVLFNWHHRSIDGGDLTSRYNIINNYFKPGPVTKQGPIRYRILKPSNTWSKNVPISQWGRAYVSGNYVVGYPKVSANNWDGGVQFENPPGTPDAGADMTDPGRLDAVMRRVRVKKPFPMAPVVTQTAQDAYTSVLANVGATLPRRDPVDLRIIKEVRTGKTTYKDGIITDINQVGGYPAYKGTPEKDLGPNGIPLWWKKKYGLNVNDPKLADKDLTGDGYTVMDKYLDGLDPTKKIDWNNPASNVNTLTEAELRPDNS